VNRAVRTTTTTQLLEALFDPQDEEVWREFDARYRPIIHGLAMRLGLGADDASEVAQATMTDFVWEYRRGRYQRELGRLRSWIMGIARNRIHDVMRQRARRRDWRGESGFRGLPDNQQLDEMWEAERERTILSAAMNELRTRTKTDEKTMRAFELVAIYGVPAEAVAAECSLSVAEVYRVKNRITKRLREFVASLTSAYEDRE
jgi:RNA polymerase sigma factor (sigma-70 family)